MRESSCDASIFKALMLEGNPNIPGMSIAVNVTLTIKLNKAKYIIDLYYTSLSLSLSLSLYVCVCVSAKGTINKRSDVITAVDSTSQQFKQMKANCIYQLITLKLRRLRSIVVIFLFVLNNTLIWTLILISQNSTPEYRSGTGELFSEVD